MPSCWPHIVKGMLPCPNSLLGKSPKFQIVLWWANHGSPLQKIKSELGKHLQIINMYHIILIHKFHPRNIVSDLFHPWSVVHWPFYVLHERWVNFFGVDRMALFFFVIHMFIGLTCWTLCLVTNFNSYVKSYNIFT